MIELLNVIFDFLEMIPHSAAMFLLTGVVVFLYRTQMTVNKHFREFEKDVNERFQNGVTNFELINENLDNIEDHFVQVHEEMRSVYKMVLKDIIYNESMDLMERQDAYEEYIGLGGNGFVQRYYNQKLKAKIEKYIDEGHIR